MIYTGLHRHLYTQNALKEKHGEHTCVCAFTHTHIHTQKERIYNSAEEMADEGHSNLKPRANIHSEPRCGEREMAFSKDSSPTSQGYLLSSLWIFGNRVSCPQTQHVAKNDLELLPSICVS